MKKTTGTVKSLNSTSNKKKAAGPKKNDSGLEDRDDLGTSRTPNENNVEAVSCLLASR